MQSRHHIELPGNRTLVAHSQPGEGTPVVFLHGLFGSGSAWSEVCAGLTQPAVAFDLPGFGGSDLPLRSEVAAYAADLAAGLDSLGVDRFELVGHSFGGAVAASLAELVGERVVALTLLAPAGFGRIALAEVATVPGLSVLARRRLATEADRTATRALVAAGRRARAAATYAGPVTALWGSADSVVRPAHARHVAASFPQADVVVLDGADHHLVSGSRDAVVELLRTGRTPRGARRSARRRRLPRPSFPRFVPAPRFA
jgi:pimeloyl-ACP methyl ester carboxylesterase